MNSEESKKLKPGMRVRVTGLTDKANPKDVAFCQRNRSRDWFFPIPSVAELLELDTLDGRGDWLAKFEDGSEWVVEPEFVEFEVIEG